MSAGSFTFTRYQASYIDGSSVHPIRVQPETLSLSYAGTANAPTGDSITNPISALSSIGSRAKGLKPRSVTIQFPETGAPTGYKPLGVTTIPILTPELWDAIIPNTTITYLGASCRVVSKTAESAD